MESRKVSPSSCHRPAGFHLRAGLLSAMIACLLFAGAAWGTGPDRDDQAETRAAVLELAPDMASREAEATQGCNAGAQVATATDSGDSGKGQSCYCSATKATPLVHEVASSCAAAQTAAIDSARALIFCWQGTTCWETVIPGPCIDLDIAKKVSAQAFYQCEVCFGVR